MTLHKFMIGQSVDFDGKLSMSRPQGPFEIVSVLPVEDASSLTYRVKSHAEPFLRAAKESDLVAVDMPTSQPTTEPPSADSVSGRWLPRPLKSR
jgi:hypothetical protein